MPRSHCRLSRTREQIKRTSLGYRTFRCPACTRGCNERSGTPSSDLRVPEDIVFLVVPWRPRSPLSLRHLAEMSLERGFAFSHETVRSREATPARGYPAPLLTEHLRARRKGKAGPRGHPDEACVKAHGTWCSLSRAIDADGNLVDSMLGGVAGEAHAGYVRHGPEGHAAAPCAGPGGRPAALCYPILATPREPQRYPGRSGPHGDRPQDLAAGDGRHALRLGRLGHRAGRRVRSLAPLDHRRQPAADVASRRIGTGRTAPQREERRLRRRLRRGQVAQQPQHLAEVMAGVAIVEQGEGGGVPRRQA